MSGIKLLNNHGIQYIGKKEVLNKNQKTLIILGVARGGTSLIAGSLVHLGIFSGEKSVQPVFEDVTLATVFEDQNYEEAKVIIDRYNKNDIWSFKRPSSINYIKEIDNLCRNPIYLIVFKDIFSISNRNNISMKSNVIHGLKQAHEDYAKILSFISETNPNAFLFSYEKVMGNKEFFIDTLINLIGKEKVSSQQKDSLYHFIEPNPQAYLDASRITKSIGQIGGIKRNSVHGWGKYIHSDKAAIVELYINNKFIISKIANDFRQNVLDAKKHPTGHCGYNFNLTNSSLKDGDKVSVKLEDDVLFLNGSNTIYRDIKQ